MLTLNALTKSNMTEMVSQACSISLYNVIALNLYPPTSKKKEVIQHKIEIFFI